MEQLLKQTLNELREVRKDIAEIKEMMNLKPKERTKRGLIPK